MKKKKKKKRKTNNEKEKRGMGLLPTGREVTYISIQDIE